MARKPTLIKTDVSAGIIHLKMRIAMLKGNTVLKTVKKKHKTHILKSTDTIIGYFSNQEVKCIRHSQICYKNANDL